MNKPKTTKDQQEQTAGMKAKKSFIQTMAMPDSLYRKCLIISRRTGLKITDIFRLAVSEYCEKNKSD